MPTPTLLPLETWRRLMKYHPWHFWQISDNTGLKNNSSCPSVVFEHGWQTAQYVGREEIRQSIVKAENQLREYLGYSVAPEYQTETVLYPRYHDSAQHYATPIDTSGRWLSQRVRYGQIQTVGILARTVQAANSAVTFSDLDGDGYNETFSVGPIATTVTDPREIACYFSSADRWDGSPLSDDWRIQPIRATISGGFVTITGPSQMLVKPVNYNGVARQALSVSASTFVTTLDVYRRYTDGSGTTVDTSQAVLHWETEPQGLACCNCVVTGGSSDPGSEYQAVARAGIRDYKEGILFTGQALYDATAATWSQVAWGQCTQPDRVTLRYYAGQQTDALGHIDGPLALVIAQLAAANLAATPCGCEVANRDLAYWQFDLGRTAGANDEAYGAVTVADLSGPFGTRRGHVAAWRYVQNQRRLYGISI